MSVILLPLLMLLGCSVTDVNYTPGELDPAQRARCRAVAEAYLARAKDYPAMREGLRDDPVALAWFVRYLELRIVGLREGSVEILGEETVAAEDVRLEKAAPTMDVPGQRPDQRAVAEIVAIGEPAVTVVVNDLALSSQEFLRGIGFELLAGIGDPAVPALLELASTGDADQQRVAARALGEIGAEGPALAALRTLASSPIWRIRSSAAQGLATGGPQARALLIEMLADQDPFVRRMAGQSLANYRDRVAATALIDYLESCQKSEDLEGELTAQRSLRMMAQVRAPKTISAWRRFAKALPDEIGSKEAGR